MAVRRRINRYRHEPSGYDYKEVLKKAKAFFRASEKFEMQPFDSTITGENRIMWMATSETLPPFKPSKGTRFYRFNRKKKRWEEIIKEC